MADKASFYLISTKDERDMKSIIEQEDKGSPGL